MLSDMRIAFFGSSLVSAYWNGAATYYRGMVRALAERGHRITFYEPDAYDRQKHRDMPDPEWARVVVYPGDSLDAARRCLDQAVALSDLIVKASGVGVFDRELEQWVAELTTPKCWTAFWDVDAPATLERIDMDRSDPFRALVQRYSIVLTYGGGDPVVRAYQALGARRVVPIYNALDPTTHHPVQVDPAYEVDLAFLGNRLPYREQRVEEFFLKAAQMLPTRRFLLGGNGWQDKPMSRNVRYLGHVSTNLHNALNSAALAVLNINRASMARFGFSPPTRVFEAVGAGACLICDRWPGIEQFLEPNREVLVADDGEQVAAHVRDLTRTRAQRIGQAALKRMLAHHTYAHRALVFEQAMASLADDATRWRSNAMTAPTGVQRP